MRRLTERGPCEILWTENKFKLDFKLPVPQLKLVIKVPMFLSYLPPTLHCSLAIYTVGCLNCPSSPTKQPNSPTQQFSGCAELNILLCHPTKLSRVLINCHWSPARENKLRFVSLFTEIENWPVLMQNQLNDKVLFISWRFYWNPCSVGL